MSKEIYLIRGKKTESYSEFKERISDAVLNLISETEVSTAKFTITEVAPPKISIIPFSKNKMAAISIFKPDLIPVERLIKEDGFYGAYQVTEVLPVAYQKDWKDGEPTPGTCLLTLFSQKKSIDYKTFIDRWHNSHTPLSLRFHPLWNYVRNVVDESLNDNSKWFDGIVEEQVRKTEDLLNPFRFFGSPLVIIQRMLMVYVDTKSFIDYPGMETYLATEYHVKS